MLTTNCPDPPPVPSSSTSYGVLAETPPAGNRQQRPLTSAALPDTPKKITNSILRQSLFRNTSSCKAEMSSKRCRLSSAATALINCTTNSSSCDSNASPVRVVMTRAMTATRSLIDDDDDVDVSEDDADDNQNHQPSDVFRFGGSSSGDRHQNNSNNNNDGGNSNSKINNNNNNNRGPMINTPTSEHHTPVASTSAAASAQNQSASQQSAGPRVFTDERSRRQYLARRAKNNEAARRSRDKKKQEEMLMRQLLNKCHVRLMQLRVTARFWANCYQEVVSKTNVASAHDVQMLRHFDQVINSPVLDESPIDLADGYSISSTEFVATLKNTLPEYYKLLQELGYNVSMDEIMTATTPNPTASSGQQIEAAAGRSAYLTADTAGYMAASPAHLVTATGRQQGTLVETPHLGASSSSQQPMRQRTNSGTSVHERDGGYAEFCRSLGRQAQQQQQQQQQQLSVISAGSSPASVAMAAHQGRRLSNASSIVLSAPIECGEEETGENDDDDADEVGNAVDDDESQDHQQGLSTFGGDGNDDGRKSDGRRSISQPPRASDLDVNISSTNGIEDCMTPSISGLMPPGVVCNDSGIDLGASALFCSATSGISNNSVAAAAAAAAFDASLNSSRSPSALPPLHAVQQQQQQQLQLQQQLGYNLPSMMRRPNINTPTGRYYANNMALFHQNQQLQMMAPPSLQQHLDVSDYHQQALEQQQQQQTTTPSQQWACGNAFMPASAPAAYHPWSTAAAAVSPWFANSNDLSRFQSAYGTNATAAANGGAYVYGNGADASSAFFPYAQTPTGPYTASARQTATASVNSSSQFYTTTPTGRPDFYYAPSNRLMGSPMAVTAPTDSQQQQQQQSADNPSVGVDCFGGDDLQQGAIGTSGGEGGDDSAVQSASGYYAASRYGRNFRFLGDQSTPPPPQSGVTPTRKRVASITLTDDGGDGASPVGDDQQQQQQHQEAGAADDDMSSLADFGNDTLMPAASSTGFLGSHAAMSMYNAAVAAAKAVASSSLLVPPPAHGPIALTTTPSSSINNNNNHQAMATNTTPSNLLPAVESIWRTRSTRS